MTDSAQLPKQNSSDNPVLVRIHDRESIRTLCLVHGMILHQIRRSDVRELEKFLGNHGRRKAAYEVDQLLTVAEELCAKKKRTRRFRRSRAGRRRGGE